MSDRPKNWEMQLEPFRSRIAELEAELEREIIQRDYWTEQATTLAMAVGEHLDLDVGEHSNLNCPVENAINWISSVSCGDLKIDALLSTGGEG